MTPSVHTPSTSEPSSPTGRFKPLVSLNNHKWLAVFIFFLISGLGYQIAKMKGKPTYTTEATILVSPRSSNNLDSKTSDLRGDQYVLYLSQQEEMLTRTDILREALRIPKVHALWMLPDESEEMAIFRLRSALSVDIKLRNNPFIRVRLSGGSPLGLEVIVNAVIDTYLKKNQMEAFSDSDGRITALQQRRQELSQAIPNWLGKRTKIAEELGVTTFQENQLNPYDKILIDTTSALSLARRERAQVESQLQALQKKLDNNTVLDTLANEIVANDNVLQNYKAKLVERRTELNNQILGMTPEHPGRRRVEQEMAQLDREIEKATEKSLQDAKERLLEKNRVDLYQAQQTEKALEKQVEEQRQQAVHYLTLYNEALTISKEIDRAYNQLDDINNRIDTLSIEAGAPGFLSLYSHAEEPIYPASNKRNKYFILFFALAVVLAAGIPLLIDLLDKRVRTPAEIHKLLGFAPIAWLLERQNKRAHELFVADQLRRLALSLERDKRNYESSYFAFTSVKPGGGTTTLVLEIANILNELGVRTLAVELNGFKPSELYQNDPASTEGLTTLLNQNTLDITLLNSVIVPASQGLPPRLPIGELSQQHLVTHGRLSSTLEYLRRYYDILLFDTPPIFLSSDLELLGQIVNCVLLIVEAEQITPGELKRASRLLERLSPPVVGTVMNRIKIYGGGYFSELLEEHETRKKARPSLLRRLF